MNHSAPLTQSQYALYVDCISHEGEPRYNLPYIYILHRSIDAERLCAAVEAAIVAHPTLFTRISLDNNGEPVQTVSDDDINLHITIDDIDSIEEEKEHLVKPFNLLQDRLFRVRIMRNSEHYYLFLDMHHIIVDGTSMNIMLNEIERAYNGEHLEPEQLTMTQVALNEAQQRAGREYEIDKQWYAQNFDCSDTFTPLLPDREEPSHAESNLLRVLNVDMELVTDFCKRNAVFKSSLFTSAYAFLLAKFNNENEALFTTVYNGRNDDRLNNTLGMMVRTLPVYAKHDSQTSVLDYILNQQSQMSGCREHSTYSFSDIVTDLKLQSNSMFAWHGTIFSHNTLLGEPMQAVRIGNSTLDASLYLKVYLLNGKVHVKAEYNSNEYSEELISSLLESYEATVNGFLTKPLLADIDITTQNQLELLDSFNNTHVDYDNTATIVSLFARQVAATPDNVAVVYNGKQLTYAQVDDTSNRIAATIAQGNHRVVAVLIPRSEWMAVASLGVLKAGGIYLPLDPTYPAERLNFMIEDAGATMLIVHDDLQNIITDFNGEILVTSHIGTLPPAQQPAVDIKPSDVMILLYTSGSTGTPKGCRITHANLVAFCNWYRRYYNLEPSHRVAAYASYGFDACMMDMYPALTTGAATHIIPEEIRLDLIALNDYFERNGITHAFMTTQVGYQFATSIENRSLIHLSVGGEKLAAINPPTTYTLHNGYGPTECTIFTTTFPVKKKMKEIPIGKPLNNLKLYVVDSHGRRLPVGAPGELWVAGPQVSDGYLNRPDKTAQVYINNPFTTDEKYARVYRTGDIVRYLPSGDIGFVGRRDGQVKIRGFRIELKEVESIIREFPGISDATVQAFDDENGGKFIAAYVVSQNNVDINALNEFILDKKPPYMVPAVTMQIPAIPLNQNQKVNKRALPVPERKALDNTETNAPLNVLEQQLHQIIAGVVSNDDFGITTPLALAGLTSITAIKLAVQINKRFGVAIDSRSLIKTGTLQSIENEILNSLMQDESAQQVAPTHEQRVTAPLTYAQTGVFFECLKNPTSTIYNIPYLLSYPASVTPCELADAVKTAIELHPELSAHFSSEGDTILQTIHTDLKANVPITQMTDEKLADYKNEFVRPFNLQKAPLYRAEVVQTPSATHLLLDIHHLVFDGGSADLLIRQINQVIEGTTPEPETYTYIDFASDQQTAEQSPQFAEAQQFFATQLATCEGASEIPADIKTTGNQGFIGEVTIPVDHNRAAEFCRNTGITPAHLWLAATAYVVARHTNNRDVYLCTVSSGRSNLKISDTVGMFVNTLALAVNIGEGNVTQYLQQVSKSFDSTLMHEDFPFARIASDFGFKPAIAYAYQVGVLSQYSVKGEPIKQELLELNVPKFKINIKIETRGVVVQYDDSIYNHATAQSLAESIATVARNIIATPLSPIRQLSIVSDNQAQELGRLRNVATDVAPFALFHDCLPHFATLKPEQPALIACDDTFNYAQMNAACDRIAAALQQRGVKPRDRVALLLPRTSRLILSLFGVLKAGGAYIPCDPDYPADRVKLILDDSEARYIITTADRLADIDPEKAIDVEQLLAHDNPNKPQPVSINGDDLAYIIYTSGSTGRPKGVMLRHEGICNYLYGHPANVFANAVMTDATRILSVTTISFDAALQDIGTAFYNGKTLVLATEEQANNPLDLAQLITDKQVNMVSGTPSRWLTWLTSEDFGKAIAGISIVRAGGEKFSDQLLQQLRQTTTARIFNCYGPTEITVASNNKELTHAQAVTVGKPQLNVTEFIVDNDGNELPIGVVGELYIGGKGVARGYNNLDKMTAERFVNYHGTRVYKSGDYAKWLPDGDVVILGRTDNQIKLRGLRIELGEIENVMLSVEGMKKVVILIRKINDKEHLCAYYTASRHIDNAALKAEISKKLTQYMVPTAYLQLDSMPMTPNGKTDVKALPEPELAAAGEFVEPTNDTERTFCQIFASILQMDKVGATDNFFDLGGTSLVVTRVIIEADKAGLHVAYGDVFANPTPRSLAKLVSGDSDDSSNDDVASYDYTLINRVLQLNNLDTFRHGDRQHLGNVLVTGATGYLGIHILHQLIHSDADRIYCLVRGKSVEKAENRLRTMLFYYFENAYKDIFGTRLHVVQGDVTSDFGNEPTNINTVFNCAAIVKHFSEGTEIEDVNIGGAQRCVDFCLKHNATLVHISTASTRGLWAGEAKEDVYTEQKLYMGQFLGNKYIYSKYMAERLILNAVASQGLKAKIMRVGNLAARSTDGEFQANFTTNSFMGRIKVYNMLGCCPHEMRNKKVEFSPINEVAHAITLLATTPGGCTVFHPYNIHGQFLGDVLAELSKIGSGVNFVEQEEFAQIMDEAKADENKAKLLSSLLAYQDMAHGKKTTDVARDNNYTTQVLYRLGFNWSPTSWDYVDRMLTAISQLGFFE